MREGQREEVLWHFQARRYHFLLVVLGGWGQDLNSHPVDQLLSPRRQVGFFIQDEPFPREGFAPPPPFVTSFLGVLDP